ncbi:MAG: 3-keto-5-aminohexanoate cleavage protein, partial [Myxococcales bacterium]|nr:3-keto-5-aminohexanoate cleavage protein [Myxococcales bacterium]
AFSGAGVHHAAFATDDIHRTLERLAAAGAQTLPIPANYYDDLQAKWDLDDPMLDQLRQLNLLYDRDENGDFLHAYTGTFEDRFFFEIVQRRGYRGFGAVNAGVRMAAQASRRGISTLML